MHNFFSFSYLKIKVNYPWFTIEHRITPLYPQFCHIEQLTVPVEDFRIYSPEAACYLGLSEFQKGKILSQEHALFQVTQYLRHKTIVRWGGGGGGECLMGTSLGIFEGGIFSLLLLWVLWYDLGHGESELVEFPVFSNR